MHVWAGVIGMAVAVVAVVDFVCAVLHCSIVAIDQRSILYAVCFCRLSHYELAWPMMANDVASTSRKYPLSSAGALVVLA